MSEYTDGDHFEGDTAYNTMWTNFNIPPGNDGSGEQALYAPTMKAPRSCLEISNQYINGTQQVAVYDFCGGGYVLIKQASSAFANTYIRNYPGSSTIKTMLEYSKSFDPGIVTACPNSNLQCDVAAAFNYLTNTYDVFYARNEGNTQGYTQGWNQIETHFAAGVCYTHPDMYAIQFDLYDTPAHKNIGAVPANSYEINYSLSDGCFARGLYQFNPYVKNQAWQSIDR